MHRTKNSLIFIFITVLIDCIGIRIAFPVSASIVSEVGKVGISEAVTYGGWLMASYASMQFIFSPVLGALSDRFGRKPVLLISLLGLGIDYLFMATANSLPLLFVGRLIAGICGASISAGFAYVADISEPEKRAKNFGILAAAGGLGFIIGPFLGGILSEYGPRAPFIAAAALSLINCLYGIFILSESLDLKNRRKFSFKRANPFGVFLQLKNNSSIKPLLVIIFLMYAAAQVLPSIWPFYVKHQYHWSDLKIGYSLAFVGLMVAIVKGGVVGWVQKRIGTVYTVYLGLSFTVAGLGLFAFSNEVWMIYVFAFIYCLGGIASPALQGIISSRIQANEQGEWQGIATSIMSLANIISPLIMTNLFSCFTRNESSTHFPGIAFMVAAFAVLAALLLSISQFGNKKAVVPGKLI